MTRARPLELERIRHVQGEMLRGRDLRDQLAADLELLWWHQRAVHEPGVVAGLRIGWKAGDATVRVEPGLAYDAEGHELELAEPHDVPVSAPERPSALVIARHPDRHRAQLAWRPVAALGSCDGIPLALLDTRGVVRPWATGARSLTRPRFAVGETPAYGTAWQLWRTDVRGDDVLGVQVRVDTRAAGFTDVPCYLAWLVWPRVGQTSYGPETYASLSLQSVRDEAASGFTFGVFVFARTLTHRSASKRVLSVARRERLSVCWLGVQCDHDQPGTKRRRHVDIG